VRDWNGSINPTFIIAPFIRTPANILKYTGERTPLAPIMRTFRDNIAAGGPQRDLALARLATGTGLMSVALDYASSGVITGPGPKEPAKREALMNTGWRPYSLKLGDKYISFNSTDPVAMPFAFAGAIAEMAKSKDLSPEDYDTLEEMIGHAVGAVASTIVDKSWFQGIGQFVQTIEEAPRGPGVVQSYIDRTASGLVPFSSVLGTVKRAIDPVQRDYNNFFEALMSQIPILSEALPAARNVWGEERKPQEIFGRAYDVAVPFSVSEKTGSPIDNELVRLDSGVERISKKSSFLGVPVNFRDFPQVYDEYVRLAGNELKHPAWNLGVKDYLDQVVSGQHPLSSIYTMLSDGPDGGKADFIKKAVREYRQLAQQKIMSEADRFPEFAAYVKDKQNKSQQLKQLQTPSTPRSPSTTGFGGALALPQ
jgi:hypothetical protein